MLACITVVSSFDDGDDDEAVVEENELLDNYNTKFYSTLVLTRFGFRPNRVAGDMREMENLIFGDL